MREKKRMLEIAGLAAERILRESNEVQFQFDFDDESDKQDTIKQLKNLGASNVKYSTSVALRDTRRIMHGDFITVTLRGPNDPVKKKLLKWAADAFYNGNTRDAAEEFPELT